MKVVLFALNGSYTQTNLAVRCLRRALRDNGVEVKVVERNLKDKTLPMLHALYEERADVYGFSCYIWNLEAMLELAEDLHRLRPEARIVLGGPEVSFDTERLDRYDWIDSVLIGPGERTIVELCRRIEAGEDIPRRMYGVSDELSFGEGILYDDSDTLNGSMVYYESSRGCPFRCSYCLSSAERSVVAKTAEQTLEELLAFEALDGIKVVKFVDRTFNFDVERANRIWRGLLSDVYTNVYHFEVCTSLLNEESYDILARFPKGKIQLEVGLQSTNPQTLAAVSRHLAPEEVIASVERIHAMGNVHIHLDLIAGLPYEGYDRFATSFDDAYFCSDLLQMGFLKLLHGTRLREQAEEYGYVSRSKPPYTVLSSRWLSFEEMQRLECICHVLERYRDSGRFAGCLSYALSCVPSPFRFYEGLLTYIEEHDGREIQKISQPDAYRLLYSYIETLPGVNPEHFMVCMHKDYEAAEVRKKPLFMRRT